MILSIYKKPSNKASAMGLITVFLVDSIYVITNSWEVFFY